MPEEKAPRTATELVEALLDFIDGPEKDVKEIPLDIVLSDLRAKGIDPAPLIGLVREKLAKAKSQDILHEARAKRERFERIRLLITERSKQKLPSEELKRRLSEILGPQPNFAAVYRKFEKATEADIGSFFDDLLLLDNTEGKDGS